jgi:tetratricopeptide (TPR) repeat protein
MQVAAALNVALTDGQTPTGVRPQVSSPEAYDLYLRGKFHLKQRNEASMIKAVELLSEAVKLDDSFVDAHAQLAIAGVLCEIYGYSCDEDIKNHAFEYAEKAVNLDPASSQAHVSLYIALRMTDIRRSLTELRTAIALDSSNSEAYHYLGHSLAMFGHYRAAEKAELAASRLDPFLETCDASLCHIYYLTGQQEKLEQRLQAMTKKYSQSYLVHSTYGWVEWCERHWDKAVDFYEKAYALEPSSEYTTDHLADCCIRSGQTQRAIEILDRSLSANPDLWMLIARLGQAYAAAGDSESAEREAARAWAKFEETSTLIRHPETAQYHFQVAWQAALRNDRTTSLEQIKSAVARDYGNYLELRTRPDWDILRGEQEFVELLDDLEARKTAEDDVQVGAY